jgi:hypothetical protein
VLGALAMSGGALGAGAQPAAPPERAVVVVVAGPSEEADAMGQVVLELLGRLGVEATVAHVERIDPAVVLTPRPDGRRPVARAWIDLAGLERATVYVVDAPWERILTRHVARAPDNAELTREELGHILETAVEAMLAGARIGVERVVQAPPPRRQPAPTPGRTSRPAPRTTPEPRPSFIAGPVVGYAVAPLGPSAPPSHGPVLAASLEAPRLPLRPGVWASGQMRAPQLVDGEPIGVRLETVALRLLGTVRWQLSPPLRLRVGIGGGVDITHIEPRSDGSARLTDARWLALPAVSALVGPEIRVAPGLAVVLATTCDIDPSDARYLARQDGRPVEILDPWTVRPGLLLGVRFLGPGDAGAR